MDLLKNHLLVSEFISPWHINVLAVPGYVHLNLLYNYTVFGVFLFVLFSPR